MKKRTGFVSNSSSSSFVFGIPQDLIKDKTFSSLIIVTPEIYKQLEKTYELKDFDIHKFLDRAIEECKTKGSQEQEYFKGPDIIKIGKKVFTGNDLNNIFLENTFDWTMPKYFSKEKERISELYMIRIYEIFKEIHKESKFMSGSFGNDGTTYSSYYFERCFELYENLDYCWFCNH